MTHDPQQTSEMAPVPRQIEHEQRRSDLRFRRGDKIDGRYRVIGPVGRGGMGTVLEVEVLLDGTRRALKYCDGGELGRKRLAREVRILGSLAHPNVVPVLDANLDHDPPYFLMPLAEGSLEDELRRFVGDLAASIVVFRQICLGVQAIHDAGVVHRDLKPANVLRVAGPQYVVADLGVAKREPRESAVLTQTCAVLGTLSYLAPEQLHPGGSRHADVRTDIYQLGKILYQMVSGRVPAVIDPTTVPPGLAHAIRRATAPRPDDRYPEIDDLLRALDDYQVTPGRGATVVRLSASELILRLRLRLAGGINHQDQQAELLMVLSMLQEQTPEVFLAAFDRVPTAALGTLAREQPGLFLPSLEAYVTELERQVSRRHFAYADLVARRMQAIASSSADAQVQALALQAILIAAVALNRYAAMAIFKRLLYSINSVELALTVADMLRAHRDYFQEVVTELRIDRLHPVLRTVLDELTWIETISF